MALMSRPTSDPRLTRWWWRTLREWLYELIDPLWAAFRGDNSDDVALMNVTAINGVSAAELGVLDGLAVTTGELNQLAGLTADAAELNKADRSQSDGVAEASRNVVLDSNRDVEGKRYDINRSLVEAISGGPSYHIGAADNITISGAEKLRFGSNDFSIAARIKSGDNAPGSSIISMLDVSDDGWRLTFYSNGDIWGSINAIDVKTNSHDVLNGEWKLVGVSFVRDGNGQMYVNGVPNGPAVDVSG